MRHSSPLSATGPPAISDTGAFFRSMTLRYQIFSRWFPFLTSIWSRSLRLRPSSFKVGIFISWPSPGGAAVQSSLPSLHCLYLYPFFHQVAEFPAVEFSALQLNSRHSRDRYWVVDGPKPLSMPSKRLLPLILVPASHTDPRRYLQGCALDSPGSWNIQICSWARMASHPPR